MERLQSNPVAKIAFIAIPATMILIIPQFSDPINLPKVLALSVVSFTSLVLFLALYLRFPHMFSTQGVRVQVLLYSSLLICMIGSAILGTDNSIRIVFGTFGRNNGLIYYVSVLIICLLLLTLSISSTELTVLYKMISWTSVVFGFYSLVQFLNYDPIPWVNQYNRVIGFLGNPNFSASALATFSIFWAYRYLSTLLSAEKSSRLERIRCVSLSLMFGALSMSTDSLQGPVILALGVGMLGYVFVSIKVTSRYLPRLMLLSGIFLLIGAFFSFLGLGPLGNAFEQYTLRLRSWYALFGVKAMLGSPLHGVGVDNYVYAFRKYRTEDFVSQYGNLLSSNNAHSVPVQIGATFGVPVFILYCILQFWILFRAVSIISSRQSFLGPTKGIAVLWVLIFSQSLLSIEIIGLGVMNWILGAVILASPRNKSTAVEVIPGKSNKRDFPKRTIPEWLGALTLVSLLLGSIPSFLVFREETAFKIVSGITVNDAKSRSLVEENFERLSSFSLFDPSRVNAILPNLYQANLSSRAELVIKDLFAVESQDAYVNDLLATFYQNAQEYEEEIKIRENMRSLSPLDFRLEGILARAYFDVKDVRNLDKSVSRIYEIAPNSEEYANSRALLNSLLQN